MPAARCPRCAAEHDEDARFCTRCGLPLEADGGAPGSGRAAGPRFVTCPACGAPNAASRQRCGRCKTSFRGSPAPDPPAHPPAVGEVTAVPEEVLERGPRVVFAAAITLAALAIVAVIGILLTVNGVGLFADVTERAGRADGDVALQVASVRASSVLPADGGETHEPENLLDGDPATAWREGAAGRGEGEWVELELAGTPEVSRLLLWNGYQRGGELTSTTRAAEVRIDLGERAFTAELLDVSGPQAVELPERVSASSLRLTVLAVAPGRGPLALSGLEVRGPAPAATDVGD